MSVPYARSATTPTNQAGWLLAKRTVAAERMQSAWLTNDFGVIRLFSWPSLLQSVLPFQPFSLQFQGEQLINVRASGATLWPVSANMLFAQYCNDCLRLLLAEGEPSNLAASYGELLVAMQHQPWQELWHPFEQQLYQQALALGTAESSNWQQTFIASLPVAVRPFIEKQRNILESMQ
ncbi:hypothetical protein [Salinibius halmophilus]|uniref:hypothetical protein n=1 Tax=Salinibius halmophilus TaxID=1853216 RepID=UPI000E669DC2|nr:hypothetical protein [Salinibius halmophilus]